MLCCNTQTGHNHPSAQQADVCTHQCNKNKSKHKVHYGVGLHYFIFYCFFYFLWLLIPIIIFIYIGIFYLSKWVGQYCFFEAFFRLLYFIFMNLTAGFAL